MDFDCEIMVICHMCGEEYFLDVREEDYNAYMNGELVQNAFPYLNADERELLITGWCPKCQAKYFGY